MRPRFLLLFLLSISLFSCKKEIESFHQPITPPPSEPVARPVLLKDIIIPNLPSPYYHFEYNADSTVHVASFASDFKKYSVNYATGRISEMTNNIGGLQERLQYFYDDAGRVIAIHYFDLAGTLTTKVSFTYAGKLLVKLERQRKLGADFFLNKTMTFSYYDDGNLKEIIDHRPDVAGAQTESTSSDRFGQYDNKINVDGFGLVHNDFFDHLLLLPGVQLQKNNPGKEIFTSTVNSYEVTFTYSYDDQNRPLTKQGDGIVTAGPSSGQTFQTNSAFSYY